MDQKTALKIMLAGENCFLTGAAGTGKTYVLNEFIRKAKKKKRRVAVTASTGIAATHLNGSTVHSWSGIGARDKLALKFFTKMPQSRQEAIRRAQILVIDEISMLSASFLDLIDEICRRVRANMFQPFGGLQLILCGDFFQLPPVVREGELKLAYDSAVWQESDFKVLYLEKQYRQSDEQYLDILNGIRSGDYRRGQIEALMGRIGVDIDEAATQVHTHNFAVDRVNNRRLADILDEEKVFEASFKGGKTYRERLGKSVLAPAELVLKKGALVMSVKNVAEKGFFNGSVGEVIDFGEGGWPIVQFGERRVRVEPESWEMIDGEISRATMTQVPLRLAWAITVHKSQGMTLSAAKIDLGRAFEYGMGYVALSRVRSLAGLALLGLNRKAIEVNPEVLERDLKMRKASSELKNYLSKKQD